MFSWIEPRYGTSTGVPFLITARKYFALSNDISSESDINGTITFTNLTVIGSSEYVAYLLVSVDGVASVWTEIYNPNVL
jgi:hypothetical protein